MIKILITDIDGKELNLSHKVKLIGLDGKETKPYPIRLAPTQTGYEVLVLLDNNKHVTLMRNASAQKFKIHKEK